MKKYNSYKDSGVEWIGKIPKHWVKSKVKFSMMDDGFRSGPFGSSLITNQLVDRGKYLVYTPEHVVGKQIDFPLFVPSEREVELSKYLVKSGDIIIPIVGTLGRGKIITDNEPIGILNQRLCRLTPNQKKINIDLLLLLLTDSNVIKTQFDLEKRGSILDHITKEILFNLIIPLPPLSEQQQIISFLNYKTQKIDSLIQKKENKIKLLKEKRTSLINQVVTKGLDSNVEMKDSGVEWIGEIPSHWEMKKVKFLFEIRKRISGELGYDVLSVTQRGLKVKDIISGKGQVSMDYTKYQIVQKGDFVMNHMDLLTGYVDVSSQLGVTSPDYRVFTLIDNNSNSDFYLSIFQFGYKNKIFYGSGQGSSMFGRWRLPSRQFNEFKFPYPSLKEQNEIVKSLNEQTEEIDTLIQLEKNKIELLKDYRQSLISEVVTGKVRVCEEDYSLNLETQKV